MEEKDIFRISIIGKFDDEIDVRCDVCDDFFELSAAIIVQEMNKYPRFKDAIKNAISLYER